MTSPEKNNIIIYDGVCNLCDSFVLFVIDRDKNNKFIFTSLQDDYAKELLKKTNKNFGDSILLYSNGIIYNKSNAVIRIFKELGFPYYMLKFTLIIPKFLRDTMYAFVAKNRYKWFGKREACRIPTKELSRKFI
jgi:predicted DCC family thiol-disulfide oxidoreductase YuxK|tara:strand:+ start:2324 stop:2725 length:402 start_codon:yes stop_codon:yes gene_type:complete